MYKHILLPTDGSELSGRAVQQGMAFAKSIGARVTVLTVTAPFHTLTVNAVMLAGTPEQYEQDCASFVRRLRDTAREASITLGVVTDFLHVVHDHPYEAIIDSATKNQCDLVFMASHGRKGVSALLLGSETSKVLTHSKIPVLVCR
jgi:nucleotide-binding universal stress UspA family protein